MNKVIGIVFVIILLGGAFYYFKPAQDPNQEIIDQFDKWVQKCEATSTMSGIPLYAHVRSFKKELTDQFLLIVPEYNLTLDGKDEFIKKATQVAAMVPEHKISLSDYKISLNGIKASVYLQASIKTKDHQSSRQIHIKLIKDGDWIIDSVKVLEPSK